MINGFVGFQLYEDGTTLSVWLLRICSVTMFLISFAVSLLTFKSWAGLNPENTVGLFVVVYVFSALFLFIYVIMQILLVLGTLQERWPLWNIGVGVFALVIGQVLLYVLSDTLCKGVAHYMDGLFFATLLNLLAVMMVYKVSNSSLPADGKCDANRRQYWDSITKEDLEFSVGARQGNWEVKELLSDEDRQHAIYQDSEYSTSFSHQQPQNRGSIYGY